MSDVRPATPAMDTPERSGISARPASSNPGILRLFILPAGIGASLMFTALKKVHNSCMTSKRVIEGNSLMRVLIQDCVTKLFLRNAKTGNWCESPADAKDFGSSVPALNHVTEHRLPDCKLILTFGKPEFDIELSASGNLRHANGNSRQVNGAANSTAARSRTNYTPAVKRQSAARRATGL